MEILHDQQAQITVPGKHAELRVDTQQPTDVVAA